MALDGFVPQAKLFPHELKRMREALAAHGFRAASTSGDDEPVSSIRADRARREAVPPGFARLLSNEPLEVDFGSEDCTLILTTEDGERVAKLSSPEARRRYRVRARPDAVLLLLAEGEPCRGFPKRLELILDGEKTVLRHPEIGVAPAQVINADFAANVRLLIG